MNCTIPILCGERWWGLAAAHGTRFPLHEASEYSYHPTAAFTGNQEAPLLVSSMGRYLWSDRPYDVDVKDGVITVSNAAEDFALYEGYQTLRGAFCAAAAAFRFLSPPVRRPPGRLCRKALMLPRIFSGRGIF